MRISPQDRWTTTDSVLTAVGIGMVALETRGVVDRQNDDTISEFTRTVFRTDTTTGRRLWVGVWCGFSAWYLGHILDWWK